MIRHGLSAAAIAGAVILAALPPARAQESHDGHAEHLAEAGAVRLVHAWSRATEEAQALVFVEIGNTGTEAVTLAGGATERAATVEVVGFDLEDDGGVYVPLGALPIAAGATIELAPEGVALRLGGLLAPLREGESFDMEIHFDTGHAEVEVAVEAADARRHGHAGHRH